MPKGKAAAASSGPSAVYVLANSGEVNHRVIQDGQPPTTIAAWYIEISDDRTLDEVLTEYASTLPLTTELVVLDAAGAQHYVIQGKLAPAPAKEPAA